MRQKIDEIHNYRDEIIKLVSGNVDSEIFDKILEILEQDGCPMFLTQKVIEYHPRILMEYFRRNEDSDRIKYIEKKALKLLLPTLTYIDKTEDILKHQNMIKRILTDIAIDEIRKVNAPKEWDA